MVHSEMQLAKFGSVFAARCLRGIWLASVALVANAGCKFPDYAFAVSTPDPPDGCSGADCAPHCPQGFADCNGMPDDACETALATRTDCGACGADCSNTHGVTRCVSDADGGAACEPTCAPGYADCDLDPKNGCETDINRDSIHCGSCSNACSGNGGTPLCQGGHCGVSSCNDGFGDCTNSGSCTFKLNSDPSNCGHCGHVCSSAHGSPICNGGTCEIQCDSGFGDCNAQIAGGAWAPDDGCETKLNVPDNGGSVPNCGACGAACNRRAFTTVSLEQCAAGVCARDCFVGLADCDDNRDDPQCLGSGCGCETSIGSNAANCGACGHRCLGGACVNSVCECPDSKPTSGSTKCSLSSSVNCGTYANGCHCNCKSGVFQCVDGAGKAC